LQIGEGLIYNLQSTICNELVAQKAAIHQPGRAGDEAGIVAGEKGDHAADLLGPATPIQRRVAKELASRAAFGGMPGHIVAGLGVDVAGGDIVDTDAVGRELDRRRLGQAIQPGLLAQ